MEKPQRLLSATSFPDPKSTALLPPVHVFTRHRKVFGEKSQGSGLSKQ